MCFVAVYIGGVYISSVECGPRINIMCPHWYTFQNLRVPQAISTQGRDHKRECDLNIKDVKW